MAAAPSANLAGLFDQVQIVDRITPVDGYERGSRKGEGCVFGPAWNDPTDHSGCDARFLGVFNVLHPAVLNEWHSTGTEVP